LEKVFILVLAIGVAVFIALPLFRKRVEETQFCEGSGTAEGPLEERLKRLGIKKESLLNAIKEIEFDYTLGKLSKEDYDELQKRYKIQAALVLKEIDSIMGEIDTPNLEEEVEREIRLIRESMSVGEDDIEKEILRARRSKSICPDCGNEHKAGDRFCSVCGRRLYEDKDKKAQRV
jgi:hypothetical protein